MTLLKQFKAIILILIIVPSIASAQVMKRTSCAVPLDERKSAPSIDLLSSDESPIDRDSLIDLINSGVDTSNFEPQLSDFYIKDQLTSVEYNVNFPSEEDAVKKPFQFISYAEVDHLTQARIVDPNNANEAYNMTVTYDVNAAVARNALLRKLGYNIPSPKLYKKLSVTFEDLDTRDEFLTKIAKIRDLGLWVNGGIEEVNKKQLTITLINVALESSLLLNIPPMHWGIFKADTIQSRRPFRALLVPLTLLDIDESVNMYSYEPAKIENNNIVFSRVYANSFKNETSLGDVKWIAKRIAKLTRSDWTDIIRAGHYPADIEALIIEKTIGRTNQLMALLQIKDYKPLPYNRYITYGNVINGKAYQPHYDGYPHFFTYGDPLNPLRLSEMARFFGVEIISNGIKFALDKANTYLQALSADKYIKKHSEKFNQDLLNHVQNHPGEPYIQPITAWGGPIAGAGISANRSVVAGTYYGSSSPVQMVDSISVNARVGAFIGVSGLKSIGLSASPAVTYNRSYVHVRPIEDIKTALKDNWTHLAVPFTMAKLSNVLLQKEGQDSSTTIDNFLSEMKTGEMFIIVDGITLSNTTMIGIPIGAMLGLMPPISNVSETINVTNQYAITSRTTIFKSEKGLQVYLSKIKSKNNGLSADTDFFLRLFSVDGAKLKGSAHTDAFVFPSEFSNDVEKTNFQTGIRSLLRKNNSDIIEQNFKPFDLDHESDGKKLKIKLGPWQWTRRETLNRLDIIPPVDPEGKYDAMANKRTVIQGQINKIGGWDFYGFFGSILNKFYSFINLGGGAKGDDPASNFMGKSKSLVVSTEMETTDSRPNKTLVKIQQTYAGWTMRKKKLLKLLESIGDKLENFNPNGGLIDEDSFTQTKRVQAYNVIWNLSIYEEGLEKLLNVLNPKIYNTKSATNFMANLMGLDEYKRFCRNNGKSVGFTNGPISIDNIEDRENQAFETVNGQTTLVSCATPWMQSVFDLRSKLNRHPEIFAKDVHDEEIAQEKIHWINKTLMKLEAEIDLSLLIKWVGTDQSYFQVSVAGYRKGDERAQDEEGRSTYFSNTVGSINSEIRNGPIDEIANSSYISQHELTARYLSDGF
jgi:hypothetical protein